MLALFDDEMAVRWLNGSNPPKLEGDICECEYGCRTYQPFLDDGHSLFPVRVAV